MTGGSGKAGSWIVRELISGDGTRVQHDVRVFGRRPDATVEGGEYVAGDVEDLDRVMDACAGCDVIVHLAGISRHGMAPDAETFRTNVVGAFNVHEAAKQLGIRRVISTSSEAVLGWDYRSREFEPQYLPIDEDHPVRPQDSYGLSKQVLELVAESFTRATDMTTVVLRPPWIAAPEDLAEVARQGGRTLTGFRLCSYIDARDLASACRLAIERPLIGHHVLFVVADDSSVGMPLSELMPRELPSIGQKAAALTGSSPSVSNQRAKQVLGWKPVHSWRDI